MGQSLSDEHPRQRSREDLTEELVSLSSYLVTTARVADIS